MNDVEIDGRPYAVALGEGGQPLRARVDDGEFEFPAWTWGDHRDALRRHLDVVDGQLVLDEAGYARRVLARAEVADEHHARLVPLALWWAAGAGSVVSPRPVPNEWLDLGRGVRAKVRAWSFRERMVVLRECLEYRAEEPFIDPLVLVERLLSDGVLALEDDGEERIDDLDGLDAVVVHALLAALTEYSMPGANAVDDALLDDPVLASQVLRVCRAMGWTPSRVLEAPAGEIDALVALLGPQEAPARTLRRAPARSRRLHDQPDAMVLVFGESGGP
ncbi:MAG: hypothetical protein AAF799_34605 [Myxococcota bacterium]